MVYCLGLKGGLDLMCRELLYYLITYLSIILLVFWECQENHRLIYERSKNLTHT